MSVDYKDHVKQAIEIIVEALQTKTELSESTGVAQQVAHLLQNPTDPFETFGLCCDYLADLVDCDDSENNGGVLLVKSQLKLCLNDHSLHTCAFRYLLFCFQQIVPVYYRLTVEVDLLATLIGKLKCISLVKEVLVLFRVIHTDQNSKRSLTEHLININEFVKASIVICHLDLYECVNSNYILVNLLNQDHLNLIHEYLKLDSLKVTFKDISDYTNPTMHISENDLSKPKYILLDFLYYIDQLFVDIDLLDEETKGRVHRVSDLKRSIDHYVIDLLRSTVFSEIHDTALCSVCKNIMKNFYRKQLSTLLYNFKEGRMSVDVINDHIEYMKTSPFGGFLVTTTHRQVVSILSKQKNETALKQYCREHHLQAKIPSSSASQDQKKANFLKLNKKITWIDTEEDYCGFLQEIQNWSYLCLDCEWFSNRFTLRPSNKLSLVQVSNLSSCYVIDCVALFESLALYMGQFVEKIINNKAICKVGYSIEGDFQVIWKCYQDSLSDVDHAKISFDPVNVLDFRDLFFFLISETYPYRTMFDPERLAGACDQTGISQVIYLLLGSILNKTEQMSDWLRRPLRKSQKHYAALDAYSLAQCYHSLDRLLNDKFQMNLSRFVTEVYNSNLDSVKQLCKYPV